MRKSRQAGALLAAAAIVTAFAASGCAATRPAPAPGRPARPVVLSSRQVASLRTYGSADTAFGLGLLGAICAAQPTGNIVMSPVSVASGLGLARLGARGATAAAMARVMHLPAGTQSSLIAGERDRSDLLGSLRRPGINFAQSNRIWADPSLATKAAYLRDLRSAYQASLTRLPLLSDPEQARQRINKAIAQDTRGHIPSLLPSGSLNDIGWVLTNALYLKAAWAHPFDKSLTRPASFRTAGGTVLASYLNGGGITAASAGGWTAASLPYQGKRLALLALLPPLDRRPAGATLPGGCELPEPGKLAALTTKLAASHTRTSIALPKVKLAWSGSLQAALTKLGMGQAFAANANFSGISDQACCIGFVQHAATLSVGEKGTVASAATAVGVTPTDARAPSALQFDRPYLMIIEDTLTGEPLMLAWVANPHTS